VIGFLDVLVLGLGEAAVVARHVLLEEVVEHLLPAHLAPAHRHVTEFVGEGLGAVEEKEGQLLLAQVEGT